MAVVDTAPVVVAREYTVMSEVLSEERRIVVAAPAQWLPGEALPVLYVLDAERHFQAVAGMVRNMSENGAVPRMLVVGIVNGTNRGRDMTPDNRPEVTGSGGGDRFLDFLTGEVRPFVEARYPAGSLDILAGKSFGGLIALHSLLDRDDGFDAYLAISPSVWWGDALMVDRALAQLADLDSARFVFLSLANEEDSMRDPFGDLVSVFSASAPAGTRVAVRHYPDETHASTFLIGVYDGLRALFDTWLVPEYRLERGGLAGLDAHYDWLNARLGANLDISQEIMEWVGYSLIELERPGEALEAFCRNAARFPDDPAVYEGLADGYLAQDDPVAARRELERAVETSLRIGDGREDIYRRRVERLDGTP